MKYTKKHLIDNRILLLLVASLLFGFGLMTNTPTVEALSTNAGNLPHLNYYRSHLDPGGYGRCGPSSVRVLKQWPSPWNSPINDAQVGAQQPASGTNALNMQINFLGHNCTRNINPASSTSTAGSLINTETERTRYFITGYSTNKGNIANISVGDDRIIEWQSYSSSFYAKSGSNPAPSLSFRLQNLPYGNYTAYVNFTVKALMQYEAGTHNPSGGSRFACADPHTKAVSGFQFSHASACSNRTIQFAIQVNNPEPWWEYTLRGVTTSPAFTARPNQPISVSNIADGHGDTTGENFSHELQVKVGSSNYNTFESVPQSAMSSGNTRSVSDTYTPWAHLSNGTSVCFRARIMPYKGNSSHVTSSGWRYSTEKCMTISGPIWEYAHNSFTTSPSSTVRHGATVSVNNIIKNIGTTSGIRYDHDIRVKLGTDAYKNLTSWSNVVALNSGATHNRSANYTVPRNVPNGTRLCFQGRIKPFKGRRIYNNVNQTTSTGWRYSVERCITIHTPPPDFTVSANCSTISVSQITDGVDPLKNMTVKVGSIVVYDGPTNRAARSFSYPPAGQTHNAHTVSVSVTDNINNTTTKNTSVSACFSAQCDGSSANSNAGRSYIRVNESINTKSMFRNDGQLTWNAGGRVTATSTYNGDTYTPTVPNTPTGSTATLTFSPFTARNTLNQQTVTMQIRYRNSSGSDVVMETCTAQFLPYTPFYLTPQANAMSLVPTQENPSTATFTSQVDTSFPITSDANPDEFSHDNLRATRQILKNGSPVTINSSNYPNPYKGPYSLGSRPTPAISDTHNVTSVQAGDKYCGRMSIVNNEGWVNQSGAVADLHGGPVDATLACRTTYDQPYVSAFGADVIAGNDFGDDCDDPIVNQGIISAFFDKDPNRGSGTQFAAIAMTQITGFTSAKMRNGAPITPVKGLSIANAGVSPANSTYGGGYPGTHCVTDYYGRMPAEINATTNFNSTLSGVSGKHVYQLGSNSTGPGGLVANKVSNGRNVTIYVDGNMQINRNIEFDNTSWSDPEKIPSFYLIVRGDIFINSNVTRLDGVYIAQPDGPGSGGGNIYTCATETSAVGENDMFNQCNKVLEVNGAFIADTIKLNRYAHSSLRYGNNTEYLRGTGDRDCATGLRRPVCAAEIFNFSPELYLAKPALTPTSIPGQGKYDAVTSLPPVL